MVGESRNELLQWVNSELDLNYTKVEQCGTGAAYCQLMDSIIGGIPMNKVKFDTKNELDYRQNMKVLQIAFNRAGITKSIEVEKLIKCRLQDNLELLQFIRKYWMENKDVHGNYDPQSRRISSAGTISSSGTSNGSSHPLPRSRNSSGGVGVRVGSGGAGVTSTTSSRNSITSRPVASGNGSSRPASRAASGAALSSNTSPANGSTSNGGTPQVRQLPRQRRSTIETSPKTNTYLNPTTPNKLQQRNQEFNELSKQLEQANEELYEYKISYESKETERNFYFNKLIEIETLIRNTTSEENKDVVEGLTVLELANQVQEILYSTEEGFQVADEMEGIDEETF
ncbi:protein Bim1p [[Candida] railenensis]|uniref:Protein Bim1p n=1 Tax=[Candida] railenensis TaxID=45579 RepID=A0A9P0VXF5_9ASCO|nr:protein Bim1p [[Candida] railenensis]